MKLTKTTSLFFAIWLLGFLPFTTAQTIYYSTTSSDVFAFDVATCTPTLVTSGPVFNDMAASSSTLFYGLFGQQIWLLDAATGTNTLVGTYPNIISPTLELGQDGNLYLIDVLTRGLFQVNPATGASQLIGVFPAGWTSLGDLVYLEGVYYGSFNTPSGQQLVAVNLTNPAASTLVGALPVNNMVAGASVSDPNCPKMYWFGAPSTGNQSTLWEYDVNTQTWTQICSGFPAFAGGADTPNDYAFAVTCGCTTNAGNVTAQNFNLCGTSATVTVPFAGGQVLEANDILRYVLFEDLNDPEGSILEQSATSTFDFDPNTMNLGQPYYLGTIAGDNQNGAVDLNDPCLDLSNNFSQVIWRALPTVSFSLSQNEICAGDCQDLEVNFTGNAPFNLTFETSAGTTQTQNFAQNSGSFQVCPPAGFLGNLTVEAVSLADANCVCN